MPIKSFPSLHNHSYFSALDGIPSPKDYFDKCESIGMEAIAFTDHGNMGALAEASIESKGRKVKPIMGIEAYLTPSVKKMNEARKEKDKDEIQKFRSPFHIVLLVKDQTGFRNLMYLNNQAWTQGFFYSPRIDFPSLFSHKEGIIVSSACQNGIISKLILNGEKKRAVKVARRMKKEFGDDFYLELQLLDMEIQDKLNKSLIQLGEHLDIPFLVTNDVHFLNKGQHKLQAVVMEMATKGKFSYEAKENYLKSMKDWEKIRKERGSIPSKIFNKAVDNCFSVADQCNYVVETGNLYFPKFDHTTHFLYSKFPIKDKSKFFWKMTLHRAKEILGDKLKEKEYQNRIVREYKVLRDLGGMDYFLICDDLLRYVREKGSFSMIRGSANGSLIAFVFQFGLVDPIKHNIMFERFISEHRSLNDIDIDIDIRSEFRSDAVYYLREKYGEDRVVPIGSYSRMQLKRAVKDITRVFKDRLKKDLNEEEDDKKIKKIKKKMDEYSFRVINGVTSVLPGDLSLEEAISDYPPFTEWYGRNEEIVKEYIEPVIGNIANVSIHPAGIIIAPDHIDNVLPIRTQPDPHRKGQRVRSTVWENSHTGREDLNEIGMMALDVLGVKTLSVVSEVIALTKKTRGIDIDLYHIDLEDKKTLNMFNKGELIGVFQFSGGAASQIIRSTKITEFNDLIVINALARPGALTAGADKSFAKRKKNPKLIEYDHHSLKNILNDSLGILVFSEHILKTASEFAGMDPKKADALRKIIKGKNRQAFLEHKVEFIEGANKKWKGEPGIKKIANTVWDKFSQAGGYLFPRGHASSYALLGYICQYLKVHYPVEFFTCHLRYSDHKKYAAIKQVAEDVYGVRFILPSVNAPKLTFEAQKEAILWPLTALKQVGGKAAQSIIKNAPYTSIEDFHNRIDRRVCNKRVMEHLIVGGAFSSFGNIKEVYNNYSSLRGGKDAEPDWLNSKETLVSTMEGIFGFEIIPLKKLLKKKLKPYGKLDTFESFNRKTSGKKVVVFGRVSRVSKITTKKGDKMAFVSLKGSEGIFKVTFFPEAFHLAKDYLKKDNILIVSGKKNIWNKESSIVLETNRSKSSPGFIYGSWIKKL